MTRTKVICEICGQEISKSNYSKHIRRHENHPETFEEPKYKLDHDGLTCQFCGKECKNRNSLCNHERLCKENPNKQIIKQSENRIAWNKGLTKETDIRVLKQAESQKKYWSLHPGSFTGKTHTYKEKENLRKHAIRNHLGGFNFRRINYLYNGIRLDSSYEVIVAKSLDENNIDWVRPSYFEFVDKAGISHRYTPDFYLPEYDVYLDPKNDYLIKNGQRGIQYNDEQKIHWVCEQNNILVLILDKNNLTWDRIKLLVSPSG